MVGPGTGGSEHSRPAQEQQGVAPAGLRGHVDTGQTPPTWDARWDASPCLLAVLASSAGHYGFRPPGSGFCEAAVSTSGLLACAGRPLRRRRPLFWNGRCFALKPGRCFCAGTRSPLPRAAGGRAGGLPPGRRFPTRCGDRAPPALRVSHNCTPKRIRPTVDDSTPRAGGQEGDTHLSAG